MQLNYKNFELKLQYPFSISRYTYYSQPSVQVELSEGSYVGYGECTTNPYYQVSTDSLIQSLQKAKALLKNMQMETPDAVWMALKNQVKDNFALNAINNACWDLYGRQQNKPLRELINPGDLEGPLTSYTIGIDHPDAMIKKMESKPWPLYKIKLGTADDINIIRALRKHTDKPFRVDANCAWDAIETIGYATELSELNVEFIEQPLAKEDFEGMRMVSEKTSIPFIADESCQEESDIENCSHVFQGINIKLQKCGGITPALKMIRIARALGLKIMIGCMTESSIGIAAAAQLLPMVDYADLDGPLLIANDPVQGILYDQGRLIVNNQPGLGIEFK